MDDTVLGVDRDELRTLGPPRSLDDRPAGDQGLLVGKGQAPTALERRQRDREPGETDHRVQHYVCVSHQSGQGSLAGQNLGAWRVERPKLSGPRAAPPDSTAVVWQESAA